MAKFKKILTGNKSAMSCPICRSTPNDFNNMENFRNGKFNPKEPKDSIHGCQPLHAIINCFNCCLHISYKDHIKRWQGTKEFKEGIKDRKEIILKRLENAFGIKFDRPKAGGAGNTTTGGLCRRAFSEPEKLANALMLEPNLIKNFSIILGILNSHDDINVEKFDDLCKKTMIAILN